MNIDDAGTFVDIDLADFGGLQGVADESTVVIIPAYDVDFFSVEFTDNRLDARATDPDAGADGIDFRIVAVHGDLAAISGFPGDGFDGYDAFGNFGYLAFEQLLDDGRSRA